MLQPQATISSLSIIVLKLAGTEKMATRQFFHQVVQSRHSEARWSIASALPLCDMVTLERLIRNS
jgi:hypothetical protein